MKLVQVLAKGLQDTTLFFRDSKHFSVFQITFSVFQNAFSEIQKHFTDLELYFQGFGTIIYGYEIWQ